MIDLVKDLKHIFGEGRVMVIDEETDFSKLPNPFESFIDPETKRMDGYDDCIIGVVEGFGRPNILCYDKEKVLDRLMDDGMGYDEAQEYYEFNMLGSWVGEGTPCFLSYHSMSKPYVDSRTGMVKQKSQKQQQQWRDYVSGKLQEPGKDE